MSKSPQSDQSIVLGVKEASTLIATIRPAILIGALKHPDFAMMVAIVFAGFRFDGNGLANPLFDEDWRKKHLAMSIFPTNFVNWNYRRARQRRSSRRLARRRR